jgi:very-short-patch-repair endonuclease
VARKRLTSVARRLRADRTDAEERLWHYLRGRRLDGEKFVSQFQIGNYVADFACRTARLAIELDGGQHNVARDAPRTEAIERFGFRVIRFWNHEVLTNTEGVLEAIRHELLTARNGGGPADAPSPLTPTLSPQGRGSPCGTADEGGKKPHAS